jgi:hypothetical protein
MLQKMRCIKEDWLREARVFLEKRGTLKANLPTLFLYPYGKVHLQRQKNRHKTVLSKQLSQPSRIVLPFKNPTDVIIASR